MTKNISLQVKQVLKIVLGCGFLFFQIIIGKGQTQTKEIQFEQFLETKIENDTDFITAVYRNIKYPFDARKRLAEEKIEILLQVKEDGTISLKQINHNNYFYEIISNLEKPINKLDINKSEVFNTRFFIYFDINPFKYSKKDFEKVNLGLINSNIMVVQGYEVPELEFYHDEIRDKKKN